MLFLFLKRDCHMKHILILSILMSAAIAWTQPVIKVEVSADTVGVGQFVEITYTIENGDGTFEPPDMSGLPVISGPNSSTSMMYQNGKMSSSQSYSYVLRPEEEGKILVPPARYADKTGTIEVMANDIVVNKYGPRGALKKSVPESSPVKPVREKKKF
jgi:hypothetical protein